MTEPQIQCCIATVLRRGQMNTHAKKGTANLQQLRNTAADANTKQTIHAFLHLCQSCCSGFYTRIKQNMSQPCRKGWYRLVSPVMYLAEHLERQGDVGNHVSLTAVCIFQPNPAFAGVHHALSS